MNIETLHKYAIGKPNAEVCFLLVKETLVLKLYGKIFLLACLDSHQLQFNPFYALAINVYFSFKLLINSIKKIINMKFDMISM